MLRNEMRVLMAERYSILNKDLIVKNNQDELIELVKDIVKNIPTGLEKKKKKEPKGKKKKVDEEESNIWNLKIDYICHSVKMPTQKDKSDHALVQYVKFRNISFDYDYYVKLEDSHVMEVDVKVMFSPYAYKTNFQDTLLYNTKRELKLLMRTHDIEMSKNVENVLSYEGEPYIDETNENSTISLIHDLKLYIPVNRNGCYIINGRRHYNGYFLIGSKSIELGSMIMNAEGKREAKNDIIIHHRSSVSYMTFDTNIVIHKVFGKVVNPFLYEDIERWADVEDIFQEYDLSDEQWDQLKATHNLYLKDKKEGTLEIPLEKALAEIAVVDVYDAIVLYYDSVNHPEKYENKERDMYLSKYHGLRSSHKPNVEHPIRSCVPAFKGNEPKRALKQWNVHPSTMLTAIIQKKQFLSSDDVNPLDVFNMLYFVKTESSRIGDLARYITRDMLFKVDLIYAPGEIGAAGNVCCSTDIDVKW